MLRYRLKNALVGIPAFVLTEIGRSFYRPYIYAHGIHDFGIADTLGNSLGTVTAIFIILTVSGRNSSWDYRLIGLLTVGLCVYELLQGPMGGAIDPKDILATIIAGSFSAVLYRVMHHHSFRVRDVTKRGDAVSDD